MPDVVVVKVDKEELNEAPPAPKPDPRWTRLWRLLQSPLGFLWRLLWKLWALLPPRRAKK